MLRTGCVELTMEQRVWNLYHAYSNRCVRKTTRHTWTNRAPAQLCTSFENLFEWWEPLCVVGSSRIALSDSEPAGPGRPRRGTRVGGDPSTGRSPRGSDAAGGPAPGTGPGPAARERGAAHAWISCCRVTMASWPGIRLRSQAGRRSSLRSLCPDSRYASACNTRGCSSQRARVQHVGCGGPDRSRVN
jgi:hypothetical protein